MFNLLNSGTDTGSMTMLIVMGVLIVALIVGSVFMQRKEKKKRQQTMSNLSVGDTVVTIGGIKGKVTAINPDDTIVVETGENTSITFFRGAIQTINPTNPPQQNAVKKEAANEKKEDEKSVPSEEIFTEIKEDAASGAVEDKKAEDAAKDDEVKN